MDGWKTHNRPKNAALYLYSVKVLFSSSCCCCRGGGGAVDGCCRIIRVYYVHFKTILMRSTVHAAFKECRLCAQKAKNHVLFTSIYCRAHTATETLGFRVYVHTYNTRWCDACAIWSNGGGGGDVGWFERIAHQSAHANTKYYCGLSIITIMTL